MRRANASPHQFIGSQSTVEANPTSGMLGVQYGVRSTDAHVGRVLHCHESPYSIVGVLGLTVTPPRRGANASRRRCGGSQSTVGPHPSLGCLTPSPPWSNPFDQDFTWHDRELFVRPPANRDQFMIQLDRPEPLGARRRSPTLHRASKEAQNGPLVARVCV